VIDGRDVLLSLPRGGDSAPPAGIMHLVLLLDLLNEETVALTQELHDVVESARYPFSARIRTRRAILNKLRPEPVREPLAPRKHYEPPRAGAKRWRSR
jgi:hypothetical protein